MWPTFIKRREPKTQIEDISQMPVSAHINEKPQCEHVKYHSAKRKTGWLKYFECNIVVPFWCFEAYLGHVKII